MDPVSLYILAHLHRAGIDYAKSIAKMAGIPQSTVENTLRKLEEVGLIERAGASSVKRSEARFKLSHEVHKHHTYYSLSREGKHFFRELKRGGVEKHLSEFSGFDFAFDLLLILSRCGCEHVGMLARLLSVSKEDVDRAVKKLRDAGLIVECRSKVIKRKHRKAKAKRETRTHHTYYTTSRLADMLLRHLH